MTNKRKYRLFKEMQKNPKKINFHTSGYRYMKVFGGGTLMYDPLTGKTFYTNKDYLKICEEEIKTILWNTFNT